MDVTQPTDDEQSKHSNTTAGCAWVDAQDLLDQMMRKLEDLLVEGVTAGSGRRVLDVGCGTGGTTLAVARRLAEGQCVGAAARARAESGGMPASFILADVQTHPFERASVDTIISRFGVMFFNDPAQAFANLRRAAENPFMTTGAREAAPLLRTFPPARRTARDSSPSPTRNGSLPSSTRVAGPTSTSSRSTSNAPCPSRSCSASSRG